MDCRLPGSSVHGILQTRILEWVAIPFSRGSSQFRDWTWVMHCRQIFYHLLLLLSRFSRVWPCANPQTAAHQAPLSLGFSRQKHWSGLPFPSPMHACMLSRFSCVQPCGTPCPAAHQAPLSTGLSRQEYWSGLPFPSPFYHLSHQETPSPRIIKPQSSTPERLDKLSRSLSLLTEAGLKSRLSDLSIVFFYFSL